MEYFVLIVLFAGFGFLYLKKTDKIDGNSNEFLLSLNENLRKEIQ